MPSEKQPVVKAVHVYVGDEARPLKADELNLVHDLAPQAVIVLRDGQSYVVRQWRVFNKRPNGDCEVEIVLDYGTYYKGWKVTVIPVELESGRWLPRYRVALASDEDLLERSGFGDEYGDSREEVILSGMRIGLETVDSLM